MKGKAHQSLVSIVCHRKVARLISVFVTIVWMQMDRNEVNRRPDIPGGQLLQKSIPVYTKRPGTEPQGVQMPGVVDLCPFNRSLQSFHSVKGKIVGRHDLASAGLEALELPELGQAHGSLDVGHVVLEAGLLDLIEPATTGTIALPRISTHTVQREYPSPCDQ